MSRTFRRKNIEDTMGKSWMRRGRKVAGFRTKATVEQSFRETAQYRYYAYPVSYRPMTPREWFRAWYYMHGESRHNNERTPNKWYRRRRCVQTRRLNKRELQKYLHNPDYGPMCERKDRSHLWDWR